MALGWRFRVVASHAPALVSYLRGILQALDVAPAGDHHATYLVSRRDDETWHLELDGVPVTSSPELQSIAQSLLWSVNQQVALHSPHALVHAAAASRGAHVLVLPASSGTGKSTLIAALVGSGWQYLTDEAVPLGPTGRTEPFRRPLTLKPGSWPLLPHLEPDAPPITPPFTTDVWHVDPSRLDGDRPPADVSIRWILFLSRCRGVPAEVEPIGEAEAVCALLRNSLNPTAIGQRQLDAVAETVRGALVGRLRYDELPDAVSAVDAFTRR